MRVTFGDDHESIFDSLVSELVRWNEKVDVQDVQDQLEGGVNLISDSLQSTFSDFAVSSGESSS